jgi:hypothetical protein
MALRVRAACLAAAIVGLAFAADAIPHSGGLDAKGCHTERKTGNYHCHRSQSSSSNPASVSPSSSVSRKAQNFVRMTSWGVCHDISSPEYNHFGSYDLFPDMDTCLRSGGKHWLGSTVEPEPLKQASPHYGKSTVKQTEDGICLPPDHPQWNSVSNYSEFPDMTSCLRVLRQAVAMPTARESSDSEVIKKSRSGICHAPESPYYARTQNFTPFKTLSECLNSGGRLPR